MVGESTGILKATRLGKDTIPSLELFDDIDPLLEASNFSKLVQIIIMQEDELASKGFLTVDVDCDCDDEENDEWIMEGYDNDRTIFYIIIGERRLVNFSQLLSFSEKLLYLTPSRMFGLL